MKRMSIVLALAALVLIPIAANAQTGVLFVVNNRVGIGTNNPQAPLEINPASGNAAFRLNFTGGSNWVISNTGQIVTFNKLGSGGQETTFRERNDASGFATFSVQGTAEATQHVNTSSRELKTDFAELDGREILAKLSEMPVSSWRYKTEDESTRHFGPVAEDFQQVFGLGNGRTISTVDAHGVSLAAIQGLHEIVRDRDAEIEALRAEVEALKEMVASR